MKIMCSTLWLGKFAFRILKNIFDVNLQPYIQPKAERFP